MSMANLLEPSSSLSYTSPSYLSNGSSRHVSPTVAAAGGNSSYGSNGDLEVMGAVPTGMVTVSLNKLSSSLERLLLDSEFDCTDAEIEVDGAIIGVHRCILAARSNFFYGMFSRKSGGSGTAAQEKRRYVINELIPCGHIGYEAFKNSIWYLYTGKLKPPDLEVSRCVDLKCSHDACRPAINSVVELMYASYIFQIEELILLLQRRLLNFVEKAYVEDVIPVLLVAFRCKLDQLSDNCVQRIARSNLDNISIRKEFPHEIAEKIKSARCESKANEPDPSELARERGITRIHRALDSDDVALVKMLLNESEITLDDANALHYAAAYCDPKIVAEVLELEMADVNLKNSRGYTPLHVAAMRGEPAVIIPLLTKGAVVSECAGDGRSASNICRGLTRQKDYNARTEQGKESNKDRICIELLEQEMGRNPMVWEESVTSPSLADNLQMKLLYLENRVSLAKLFFPTQAKYAMQIAETASKYALYGSKGSSNNLKEVDLNETPVGRAKRLRLKMTALEKTVELGMRYFPNCSKVLDKFMEDDLFDPCNFDEDAPDDQDAKRRRYHEIKEDVAKAFSKDKAENRLPGLCSTSSSHPTKGDKKQRRAAKN